MRAFWYIPLVCLILLTACGGGEDAAAKKKPGEGEPPPPPTAEQIAAEFNGVFQPMQQFISPGASVPQARIEEALTNIKSIKTKHQAGENGPEGIRIASVRAQEILRQAYEAEAWPIVLFGYRALQDLDQPATENFQRQFRYATLQVNRPIVDITGIYNDNALNVPTLFCQVTLPATGETESWRPQLGDVWERMVGDQTYSIRLEELIGENSGAVFTYIQTEETFDVRVR